MKTMMKIVATMLIAAMLLMGTALAAGKIRTEGQLNVRKGPGLDYTSVGTMKAGKVLEFDKTSTDERGVIWYHVKGGWISSRYTTQIQGSVNGGKSSRTSGDYIKATGNVNLRKGPGLDYADVGTMNKGQTADYLGSARKDARGVTWYKVSFNGRNGWVSSRYSKLY